MKEKTAGAVAWVEQSRAEQIFESSDFPLTCVLLPLMNSDGQTEIVSVGNGCVSVLRFVPKKHNLRRVFSV